MIYGKDFSGLPIPDGVRRKFARTIVPVKYRGTGVAGTIPRQIRGKPVPLQGVGQSKRELNLMLIKAFNRPGTDPAASISELAHVVKKQTGAGVWFGIYY